MMVGSARGQSAGFRGMESLFGFKCTTGAGVRGATVLFCALLLCGSIGPAAGQDVASELEEELELVGEIYVRNPSEAWQRLEALKDDVQASPDGAHWAEWNLYAALLESTTGDLDRALEYAQTGLQLYRELDQQEGIVDSILVRGNIHALRGQYREAIKDYEYVLANAEGLEDQKEFEGAAWIGLGDANAVIGDFSAALEALTSAYDIFEELGDEQAVSQTFGLLGNVYADIDAGEEAVDMYREAAALDRQLGDDLNVAINLYNMGRAQTDLGQTEAARENYREALAISDRVGSEITSGYIHFGIGLSYLEDDQRDAARTSLQRALEILGGANDNFQVALTRYQLARLDYRDGDYQQALERALSAIPPLEGTDDQKHLIDIYGLIARAYAAEEDHASAYEFLLRQNTLMSRFASEERARRVAQLRVLLDTDRAEDQARSLGEENRLKAELLERERSINRLITAGAAILAVVILALGMTYGKQKRLEERLRMLANTDDLTGLISRRRLFQLGAQELDRARRYDVPLSALVLDLDFFKSINDRYGHAIGDDVLRKISLDLERSMRDSDHLGRIGGEEFLAILPHTDKEKAVEVAERIVDSVREMDLSDVGVDDRLTMSVGVACYQGAGDSLNQIIKRADAALYQAKAQGRNQAQADWMVG